jgi:hypothetical protein
MDWQNGLAPANDPRPVTVKFLARPLERDQIAQAYALIGLADSSLSQERWTRFAHKMTAPARSGRPSGIMTLQTEAGYMCGLYAYEIVEDLRLNRTLAIRHVFAQSLVQPAAIVRSLLESAESMAHLNGCATITCTVDRHGGTPAMDWLIAELSANGFHPAGTFSAKALGSASGVGHPVLGKKA